MRRWLTSLCLVLALAYQPAVQSAPELNPFVRGSYRQIVAAHAGQPFVVAFWSVNCSYCGAELALFGRLLKKYPGFDLVLVSTDAPGDRDAIAAVLGKHALDRAERWVFADSYTDRLRFEIDPEWYGELPRSYFHGRSDDVKAISGKIEQVDVERWIRQHGLH